MPHFTFGLFLAIALDTAIDQVNVWSRDTWQEPGVLLVLLVLLELVIGGATVAFGYRLSQPSKPQSDRVPSTPMTPITAVSVAANVRSGNNHATRRLIQAISYILQWER